MPKTLHLPDFITALRDVLHNEQLVMEAEGGDSVAYVPVEIMFKTSDGIPVSCPLTAVGVRTDEHGNAVALVFTTLEEGAFNAANQAA